MIRPLAGMRVLDFSKVLAGPALYAISRRSRRRNHQGRAVRRRRRKRTWPPFRGDTGAVFLSANRNKRSLAVDLKTQARRDIARKLARSADIALESYGTGVAERLGIDFASLKRERDNIIYCSISGFGRTGPLKDNLGYDVILQAFSGIMSMTGEVGGGPIRSPFSPIDQATGIHALSGILAAVLERARTGKGCYLEVSLFETAVAFLGYNLQTYW
jgi:crotonobetainyl-CoA:carnitine CoA-transferase CaiB-like acyl-CoA transferase